MCRTLCRRTSILLMLTCCLGSLSAASANVDLEWRLETSGLIRVGDAVRIGLYAVSDDATNQVMSSMQVVITWDPTLLQLMSLDNNGFSWPTSDFLMTDPLNESNPPQDGDGLYFALGPNAPNLPEATPAGLLVTTFQFTALNTTCETILDIPASLGSPPTSTIVFSGIVGGLSITGTLGQISLTVNDVGPVDIDGDGVLTVCDNCPDTFNPGQFDSDGNGIGELCDPAPGPEPRPRPHIAPTAIGPPRPQQPPTLDVHQPEPDSMTQSLFGVCAPATPAAISMCFVGLFLMRRRRVASRRWSSRPKTLRDGQNLPSHPRRH